jgi:hypothetical protein
MFEKAPKKHFVLCFSLLESCKAAGSSNGRTRCSYVRTGSHFGHAGSVSWFMAVHEVHSPAKYDCTL